MINILVVEDDKELNKSLCKYLSSQQYQVTGCLCVEEAYDFLYGKQQCDIIISDIMMPRIDGFEFAETVRQQNQNIPILFMTAKGDYMSKKRGYRLGIDDYIVKPIELEEILWHIKALLRRANIIAQKKIVVGNLVLNEEEVAATINQIPVDLTLREFQILFKLLSYPRRTFTRSQLLDEFNGLECEAGIRTIDVHITNLRTKLMKCDSLEIVTVRGIGYKAIITSD